MSWLLRRPRTPRASRWSWLAFAGLRGTVAQSSFFRGERAVQAGMSERVAASLFAFGTVFGMAIRIAGGVFAERRPERLVVVIAVLLGLSVLGSAAFAVGTPRRRSSLCR